MSQTLFFPSLNDPLKRAPAVMPGAADPIRAVDQAVRSVLGALSVSPLVAAGVERGAIFAERLLLLRHVEALPRGTRELRIAPGTVVTPLAIQALKQREISLRFVSRNDVEQAQKRGEWAFGIEAETGVVTAYRRVLLASPESWMEIEEFSQLVLWIAASDDRGALFLTEEASVAVWQACQAPGIRAAAAETCDAAARAVRNLGVNLLVVEPAGKSIALLKQLGQTLRSGGAPRPPG